MSVKPIQDDVQVSEVGETPSSNKIDIDSQMLPLPPMTMGQFEDLVVNVVKDSAQITTPASINIEEPIPVSSKNTETVDSSAVDSSIQNALSSVIDLETRVAEALAKVSVEQSPNSFLNSSGLTDRDYVDIVRGGERRMEGQTLIDAGNFLGQEEGITFKQNSEDNTFDMIQGGEVIQSDMTQVEVNTWIADKERSQAVPDQTAEAIINQQTQKDLDTDTKMKAEEDVATSGGRPFSYDPNYMLIVGYENGTDYYELYEWLLTDKFKSSEDGNAFIKCTVKQTSGSGSNYISQTEFVNKADGDLIPFGTAYEMCEFEGTGDDAVQTAAYIPLVFGQAGQLYLVNHSGMHSETHFCHYGQSFVYPMRV